MFQLSIACVSIRHRLLFSLQHRLTPKTNKHEQSIQSMAQTGQKSERHGAYTRNGHHRDHPYACLQPLQQWCQGNKGNLHAHQFDYKMTYMIKTDEHLGQELKMNVAFYE